MEWLVRQLGYCRISGQMSSATSSDDIEDVTDFTITSIHEDAPRGALNRTKSTASFLQAPKRKSSVILATTGQKIQRSYSSYNCTDNDNNLPRQEQQINIQEAINRENSLLAYIRSLFTRPIFKSSFAYLIASLFVYSPTISNMLGTSDSKHLTCTVVVYFHPSRSVGSMLQALLFVSYSLFFGIGVSVFVFTCISLTSIDNDSSFIVVPTVLLVSVSLGMISFWKHRVTKPTFNTASSLAAILIISCVIKVYSRMLDTSDKVTIPWEKIASIISCVLCGCLISVVVCFTLWRKWAKKELAIAVGKASLEIGKTMSILCDSFLSIDNTGKEFVKRRSEITNTFKTLKAQIGKLDGLLEESMFECCSQGREQEYKLYKGLVYSCKRLLADLGGLRRSLEFKWELVEYYEELRGNDDQISDEAMQRTEQSAAASDIDHREVEKPEELINLFIYHLGPSAKSFVFTMNQILGGKFYDEEDTINNTATQYMHSLEIAKELYEFHQTEAIDSLYKQDIFAKHEGMDEKINQEEVAATCANFSFSVTQMSIELENYLNLMISLYDYKESPKRSYGFLKFWKRDAYSHADAERSQLIPIELDTEKKSFGYSIWKMLKFTRGVDFQFGFRVGLGALILASLAFLDSTRHIFNEWRGEWALVTYCIIMNKSLGGTAMTVKWRFLGTFIGAFLAYWVWQLFFPVVSIMAVSGFLVSLPCFDIILNWKANNAFGRFILLTYNLTVLYSYTMSLSGIPNDGNDWEGGGDPIIWEIAFHRYFGVSLGVIWALLITMTLFPVTARGRIKRGLSVLWLRMGLIWRRGALNSHLDEYQQKKLDGLRGLKVCHSIMGELRTLLKQAPMELRLKGAFPTEIYTKLMDGTEGVLDAYENLNSIVDVDPILSPIEGVVLDNLNEEITELQNRVFSMFYMLASALKLGLPLAGDPASTENAMLKLLSKLADVRKTVEARKEVGKSAGLKNTDFVLFYSYCLVTNFIVNELTSLMEELIHLYGQLDEESVQFI